MDNRTIEQVRDNETKLIKEITQLEKRNKALMLLLNWAEECDWGFDNFRSDDVVDWDDFEKESENLGYIESMIKYAEIYLEKTKEEK